MAVKAPAEKIATPGVVDIHEDAPERRCCDLHQSVVRRPSGLGTEDAARPRSEAPLMAFPRIPKRATAVAAATPLAAKPAAPPRKKPRSVALFPRRQAQLEPAAVAPPWSTPVTVAKPAAVDASARSTGGIGRVTSHLRLPRQGPPAAAVVIRYDAHGRPTLTADEIPW